ncbi:DUF6036 family nucleotidyltransferase [Bdellovibrionales bacterium]|nr:DUF6036 family nucleotidyltransferase [Bdellovibrionales bacterium]
MIDKENIIALLEELDDSLSDQEESRTITIYGGAALISMNLLDRATVDIDVFQPNLDESLKKAIREVGEKHLLDELWINSTGSAFITELPKDWQDRTTLLFKGEYLTVKSLGRTDLIFTKLLAELDRGEDLKDLENLKPTRKELDFIKTSLLDLEDEKTWRNKVNKLIEHLNEFSNAK